MCNEVNESLQANYLGDQLRPLVERAKGFRMVTDPPGATVG